MENLENLVEEMPVSEVTESITEIPNEPQQAVNTTNIDLLMDVSLRVTVELGRTRMQLAQILELQHGSVVELERLAGDPVDILVNDCLVARGEVVVVDDKFGVRITEMVSSKNNKTVD
jgi:flagellar motor switch protein FliN/FliY